MQNRLFIFDLDGTLLNTIGDLAVGCDHMLSLRGLPTHSYAEYCTFVGNGIMRLVERALPEHLRTAEYVAAARKDFVDYYIEHLACGIASIINIFQPEIICIGGGICNERGYLLDPLNELVEREQYTRENPQKSKIVVAELGNDAGIIGAACLGM